MTTLETKALAEVMFWYGILMLVFFAGVWVICRVYDCVDETPEERAAREAKRIAQQATKEFKRRQRMRSVRFWNFWRRWSWKFGINPSSEKYKKSPS